MKKTKVEKFIDICEEKIEPTFLQRPLFETFVNYWTETNELKGGKKMRYEDQKFFEIKKRWATFVKKEKEFSKPNFNPKNQPAPVRENWKPPERMDSGGKESKALTALREKMRIKK